MIAAFAGATLAIACERPASRVVASGEGSAPGQQAAQIAAQPPAVEAAAPAPASPMPPREALTDTSIASRIRGAIAGDPGLAGADVSVAADKGAVTLVGSVKTHEQIALASAHAQRQDGVTRVDNHLSVAAQ